MHIKAPLQKIWLVQRHEVAVQMLYVIAIVGVVVIVVDVAVVAVVAVEVPLTNAPSAASFQLELV